MPHTPRLPYIGPDGVNYGSRAIYFAISTLLVASIWYVIPCLRDIDMQGYGATEFLINFEGGFVRRGLLGQALFWFCAATGCQPVLLIQLISGVSFVFVLWFFISRFISQGYSWWFVFSPLFLGLTNYIIRKDFLEYCVLIGCLTLLRHEAPSLTKRLLATVLAILGIFIHEAFIFWGIPIFALLMADSMRKSRTGWVNILLLMVLAATFVGQCLYKGNIDTAQSIIDSWNDLLKTPLLFFNEDNSIGALSWGAVDTFKTHLLRNLNGFEGGLKGLVWQPLFMVMIYYFCTNFIFIFRRQTMTDVNERKLAFSAVYLLTLICLLPLFTILSCDYARLYQYAAVASCSSLVILPYSSIIGLFPKSFLNLVSRINSKLEWILPPGRHIMIVMLFLLAMSQSWFSLSNCLHQSVTGKLAILFTNQLHKLLLAFA